ERLRHQRAGEGLEVVGVAVDFRDAVLKYAREIGIDYPLLIGEQDGLEAVAAFGMDTVFPFTGFADSQGRVPTLQAGKLHTEETGLILDRLSDVEHGRLDLAGARRAISDGIAHLAADRARKSAGAPAPQIR